MTLVRVHNRNAQEFPVYLKGDGAVAYEVQVPPWSYVDVDDAALSKQALNLIRQSILTVDVVPPPVTTVIDGGQVGSIEPPVELPNAALWGFDEFSIVGESIAMARELPRAFATFTVT